MKRLLIGLAAVLCATAASAKTVDPYSRELVLRINGMDTGLHVQSFARFHFTAAPSPVTMRSEAWFPLQTLPGKNGALSQLWSGLADVTVLGPVRFELSAVLDSLGASGPVQLSFQRDGTWACSGDCALFAVWNKPGRVIQSGYSLTGGTYSLAAVPVPTGLLFAGSGIAALAGLRRKARRGKTELSAAG